MNHFSNPHPIGILGTLMFLRRKLPADRSGVFPLLVASSALLLAGGVIGLLA